ncbi:MAG: hypothetical protein KAJ18_02250 [Candidatus Omnitrophica bacterium]|nr:hypothetical protein [Candidatus Omnitrophota bacterium]
MRRVFKKQGSSTIEYLLLLAVTLGILISFVNFNGGLFSVSLNQTLRAGVNSMIEVSNAIAQTL